MSGLKLLTPSAVVALCELAADEGAVFVLDALIRGDEDGVLHSHRMGVAMLQAVLPWEAKPAAEVMAAAIERAIDNYDDVPTPDHLRRRWARALENA